jgi:hypothetical protein
LGFEILESKSYKNNDINQQKNKIIIRPDKEMLINILLNQHILVERQSIVPYAVKDSKKHLKNQKKKNKINGKSILQKYKVLHCTSILGKDPQEIINFFNIKIHNLISYYKHCDQYQRLYQIFNFLKISCYKTLTNKYRCKTIKKLHVKYGKNLDKLVKTNIYNKVNIFNKKINVVDENMIYDNFRENFTNFLPNSILNISESCMICGSDKHLEYYYNKSLKNLRNEIKLNKYNYFNYKYIIERPQKFFNIIHIINNKKKIIICIKCYTYIYKGTQKISLFLQNIKHLKKKINS